MWTIIVPYPILRVTSPERLSTRSDDSGLLKNVRVARQVSSRDGKPVARLSGCLFAFFVR